MSTVASNISALRGIIKQVQDDSVYTDKFLYSLLSSAKARLLRQKLDRGKLSEFNWVTFCISLEVGKSHNCDCVPVGCDVVKSVSEIPKVLNGRHNDLIRIETLGGKLIPFRTEEQILNEVEDDILGSTLKWTMRSRKLIIFNNTDLKAVQVTSVPEDISAWGDIHTCVDSSGNPTDCFDIFESDFGLDEDLTIPAYKMVLELLRIPLSLQEDITVDNNAEIKA